MRRGQRLPAGADREQEESAKHRPHRPHRWQRAYLRRFCAVGTVYPYRPHMHFTDRRSSACKLAVMQVFHSTSNCCGRCGRYFAKDLYSVAQVRVCVLGSLIESWSPCFFEAASKATEAADIALTALGPMCTSGRLKWLFSVGRGGATNRVRPDHRETSPRKAKRSLRNSSGLSTCGVWPHSGMTSSR